ncbi:helix-turn-helix domain-containing protein [Bordetella petrii]|uniref:helix-turn-helix domain-containing protein n=1 Tax=Bordetella petrii TaxID=94624 RepID=UPI001E4189FC|nr:helix-turn-helix transcriptional regulator [Bordetella petrii]MCD0504448.1 helix-turn-helix domain-containing protein [Bordetella petrii]
MKHARKLRLHTQQTLARACGLSQSTIASYENGERRSSRSFRKIAAVLRVELDWLETGKGPMEKPGAYLLSETPAPHTLMESSGPAGKSGPATTWPFPSVPPMQINALATADRREIEKWLRMMVDGYLRAYEAKGRKRRGP